MKAIKILQSVSLMLAVAFIFPANLFARTQKDLSGPLSSPNPQPVVFEKTFMEKYRYIIEQFNYTITHQPLNERLCTFSTWHAFIHNDTEIPYLCMQDAHSRFMMMRYPTYGMGPSIPFLAQNNTHNTIVTPLIANFEINFEPKEIKAIHKIMLCLEYLDFMKKYKHKTIMLTSGIGLARILGITFNLKLKLLDNGFFKATIYHSDHNTHSPLKEKLLIIPC